MRSFLAVLVVVCGQGARGENAEAGNLLGHLLKDPKVQRLRPASMEKTLEKKLAAEGTAVVLWWAYCPFCNRLMNDLGRLHTERRLRVNVIGVSIDRGEPTEAENRAQAMERATEWGLPFAQYHDYHKVLHSMMKKTDKVPFTMIFDRYGNLVATHSGVSASLRALTAADSKPGPRTKEATP